jgi:acetate kinase
MPGIEPVSVLTLNVGSSSLKFAFFSGTEKICAGKFERLGWPEGTWSCTYLKTGEKKNGEGKYARPMECLPLLGDLLEGRKPAAIAHRIVHGGPDFHRHQIITPSIVEALRGIEALAPEHLPDEIDVLEAVQRLHPGLPQIACFDTAFHHEMPAEARTLPIPRRLAEKRGLRRYGFHGLSYAYLVGELKRMGEGDGRMILAHLGNGASMAAVRGGRPVDTSMAFTPAAGLVMGTRTGDMDPGIAAFLAREENLSAADFHRLVSHESGLLGVSETSSDVRDLLDRERNDPRAAEALALFCYQARKFIGAFAAALGGLDTLVFAGGIGENSPVIRSRICEGLDFLGVALEPEANQEHLPVISVPRAGVTVRVLPTDEERYMAQTSYRLLGEYAAAPEQAFRTQAALAPSPR